MKLEKALCENELFRTYEFNEKFLDEVFMNDKEVQDDYAELVKRLTTMYKEDYKLLNEYAKMSFFNQGITFAVYKDNERGTERIFPFDLFPRIIPQEEWDMLEKGVEQRNMALNMFLEDIYNEQKIIADKVISADLIYSSGLYNKEMVGFVPPGGIYSHVSGTDLIKHADGEYYVLEDNIRSPSGVSYVLSNREAMKRTFSSFFKRFNVKPVSDYPSQLLSMMQSVAPEGVEDPVCVLLTPGPYNSAYYEHAMLAQFMGIELVEGRDLYVDQNFVYMKTINGPTKVDVIYRRIDDAFLDPLVFRPDSMLGVAGIMASYRAGNVTLINAPGTGVADDKAVYSYVPDMIKYYLGEEPILNNVPTYLCDRPKDKEYVLEHLDELVVKPVNESGGYGVYIGNKATKEEKEEMKVLLNGNPRNYIAQPIMALSVHSTFIEESECFEPRHIDLRTYSLMGNKMSYVLKGGLSRVALKKGSLVVNSSQGGGSKDTWVL